MTVLVTGCAGLIGSSVCRLLSSKRYKVVGADNMEETYDPAFKKHRMEELLKLDGFRYANVDVNNKSQLSSLFNEHSFSGVINLAAKAGIRESLEDPTGYFKSNTLSVINLLEQCREKDVSNFVLASTSSVYGEAKPPFKETSVVNRPLSPYAASKAASESLCHIYSRVHGIKTVALRLSTVYGVQGRPDMSIFRFIRWVLEGEPIRIFGGGQERDFVYVDDVAEAMLASLESNLQYQEINIGAGTTVVLEQLIKIIEAEVGAKGKISYEAANPADASTNEMDISKAARVLNWRPRTSITEGIAKTIKWYAENREWAGKVKL